MGAVRGSGDTARDTDDLYLQKDKVDKEPTGLLLRLLLAGALSVVSAIILESVGMALAGLVAESGSALYNALTCFWLSPPQKRAESCIF